MLAPSLIQRAMTWAAVALCTLLLVLGVAWYGFSLQVHQRFWADIFGRAHGPMTFRYILQPTMALIAAIPDGMRDARERHKPFFNTPRYTPPPPTGRLREGLTSTARLVLLGLSMDAIYQFRVLDQFYPAEALMMVILLAIIPYFVFRWAIEHGAVWWFGRKGRALP